MADLTREEANELSMIQSRIDNESKRLEQVENDINEVSTKLSNLISEYEDKKTKLREKLLALEISHDYGEEYLNNALFELRNFKEKHVIK